LTVCSIAGITRSLIELTVNKLDKGIDIDGLGGQAQALAGGAISSRELVEQSLARIEEGAEDVDASLAVGALFKGTVERVEPYGVFVRLGPGRTGLVPNEEMGTTRGTDHRKDFAPGTEMVVEVLAIEEGGKRIRLSRAQALQRADRAEAAEFRAREAERAGGAFSTLGDAFRAGGKKAK